MKLEIHKLMDFWEENEVAISGEADLDKIKNMSFEKMGAAKKHRPILRFALIAAALTIFLMGGVYATYRSISIEEKKPDQVVLPDDGTAPERIYFGPDYGITVDSSGEGNMVGFRPGYLPEGGMNPIRFTLKGDVTYYYSAEDAASIDADVLTETNAAIRVEKDSSDWDMLYDIRLLNSAKIYRQELSMNGEVTIIKEDKFGVYDAMWLTLNQTSKLTAVIGNEEQYSLRNAPVQNILLLYSPEYDCLLRIAGNSELLSFEDLERIATELELVSTDLPAKAGQQNGNLDGAVG